MAQDFQLKKWTDMSVKIHSRNDRQVEHHLLRGRALLSPEEAEFTFVENEPRGKRSVEIGRTMHSRFVRRPDGGYTITFRFGGREPYLRSTFISEVRDVVSAIGKDLEKIDNEAKKDKRENNTL